jgi:hypothetical protein
MITLLLIIIFILVIILGAFIMMKQSSDKKLLEVRNELLRQIDRGKNELQSIREEYIAESVRIQSEYEQRINSLENESERIRKHYQDESRKALEETHAALQKAQSELAALSHYANIADAEKIVQEQLQIAIQQAESLEKEAQAILASARQDAENERHESHLRAKNLYAESEALFIQAQRDSLRIQMEAEKRAQQLAGDAFEAMNQKRNLEGTIESIRNIVDGYGDRYIIPTHSLLDDLAADFGHIAAGESLRIAREKSRRMVAEGEAASCDYAEHSRRKTAIQFVVDAFNGKVDAVLSRIRNDNVGTLEQEIKDAFRIVNLSGGAFRNARILESYLDSRLAELRWGATVFELKRKEREEQRRIQEQIREEERARREYEKAVQDAAKEEVAIKKALEKAHQEMAQAGERDKEKYEKQLAELNLRLTEAETRSQRAVSMAQQTRSGNVYIISNAGSFGPDVIKIGMTRRLEPMDRVKELGDASVPFEFDVHAMIRSDDAPTLERELHQKFDNFRVNKVNYRKEFFRLPLKELRDFAAERKLEATFTMIAEAREYRETQALEHMSTQERSKYIKPEEPIEVEDE